MSLQDGDITPCPSRFGRGNLQFDCQDDDTAALDFTTEPSLARPVRERPRRINRLPGFKIHEDAICGQEIPKGVGPERQGLKKRTTTSSMFAQPPQRLPRPKVSSADTVSRPTLENAGKPRTRTLKSLTETQRSGTGNTGNAAADADPLKKERRRRNPIYIPPDDTTMPSGFMGMFSPLKDLNSLSCNRENAESGSPKNKARRSPLTTTGKSPLRPTCNPAQPSRTPCDIAGRRTGKENIPPGECTPPKSKTRLSDNKITQPAVPSIKPTKKRTPTRGLGGTKPISPVASMGSGIPEIPATSKSNRATPTGGIKSRTSNSGKNIQCIAKSKPAPPTHQTTAAVPKGPRRGTLSACMKYPILSENISDPSMYEEKWLEHQEIAITQLANGILESARGRPEVQDGDALRRELLEQYQGAYFSLLYKRVYASILHGALRVPQDILRRGNRLKDDIGFQRRFLNFWTGTYDLLALRAAAETVVGRRISCHEHLSTRSPDCTKGRCKSLRPAVQAFLETFLLRNEDSDESAGKKSADDDCTAVSGYQKTILRCIMMIVLLDKARTSPDTTVANRLFLPSAEHKSSTAVLQELGRMLLPSTDIIRSLNHLDCQVSYQQFPMQEYEYKIQNLAVDLRDGVIIARLAELLFFVPNQLESGIPSSVILPTGEALHLVDDNSTGPLSKHLKVPCRSRAAKLFNVQVTLSALADFGGMSAIVKEISAADIVDGYREKTIALLWGLVGKRGLSALIDWVDVKGEIRRLERKYMLKTSQQPDEMGHTVNDSGHGAHDGNGQGESQDLLTQWAARLASLKGLRLENLTTSFSDGRIFESIVDEYEFLIKSVSTADEKPTDRPMNLESRLRSLGCSAQFASLVSPRSTTASSTSPSSPTTHVFDKDFTLAALAFLCSRLLPASRYVRAGLTIQSAWRLAHAKSASRNV